MTVIFIGVLLVMAVLNLFMFFVIKRTAVRVDKQVRSYFVKQLEVCDAIYEENKALRKENATVFGPNAEALPDDRIYKAESLNFTSGGGLTESIEHRAVTYQNENFLREYKAVKNKMKIDKNRTLMAVIKEESSESEAAPGHLIADLLHSLSFDTLYKVSTLSSQQQEAIMRDVLNEKQLAFLNAYLGEKERFDVLEFFDFLKELSFSCGGDFYVKTGDLRENFDGLGQNVVTVHDPSIVEGIKIVYRNRMYDYSM